MKMYSLRKCMNFTSRFIRNFSSESSIVLEKLNNRSLISVSGNEANDYLQGLITNDIRHLSYGAGSMYAMFLNTRGRILYDVIVYRTDSDNSYLIECDKEGVESLQKHLKMYKVRRKIDISNLKDHYHIYVVFNPEDATDKKQQKVTVSKNLDGLIVPCDKLKETFPENSQACKLYKDLAIYVDPRISNLGNRIIAPTNCDAEQQINELFKVKLEAEPKVNYQWFRYKLGVGEGIKDLPPGNCFPLECNCDYLHGVSFHKGCYIGQELTARTHHTGVVRKRLMPLEFLKMPTDISEEFKISENGKRLGVLRGIKENAGLAILKVSEALGLKEFKIGNGVAKTEKPFWWPLEASKELISSQKS